MPKGILYISLAHFFRRAAGGVRDDLLTFSCMRMMDTRTGQLADIQAALIIHELHCACVTLYSQRLTEDPPSGARWRRYLSIH